MCMPLSADIPPEVSSKNLLISMAVDCVCDTFYPTTSPRERSNETRENAERAVIAARQADMALHVV